MRKYNSKVASRQQQDSIPQPLTVLAPTESSISQHCLQPRLVTATAAEGTHLSIPPRLKQQSPASATSMHFQQQPALLSGGNTNFSDLSGSHREQQQLFLLNHGCRHPSSALARTKPEERERENKKTRGKDGTEEKKRKDRGGLKVVCPQASNATSSDVFIMPALCLQQVQHCKQHQQQRSFLHLCRKHLFFSPAERQPPAYNSSTL
ncbi:hypothetical protein NC653_028511 [Populus alba x Populus x berolinensis]|uniref:Uncharacterized protein n=1 Tax=Populus alba x Populus x berolinensis TaxID=444605 RepID=A0AAD6M094_9ROSI|nr:hypothetical protein NC653_028511 [Populus alba x Populus x berolinensis]